MMSTFKSLIILVFLTAAAQAANDPCLPQQVHLSLGNEYYLALEGTVNTGFDNNSAWIVFETLEECMDASIELGIKGRALDAVTKVTTKFEDTYEEKAYTRYIHVFTTGILEKDRSYGYTAYGDVAKTLVTGPFTFTLPQHDPNAATQKPEQIIFYGDYDTREEGQLTLSRLRDEVRHRDNQNKMIMHLGDIAYDLIMKDGMQGDDFFNDMQEVTAQVPYMFTYGNHEVGQNRDNILARMRMPLWKKNSMDFFSFNLNKAHFFTWNMDLYYE